MTHPWLKFYPRDWRGDQALRVVSLAARGLWMEMLCIMHEASPYGHLMVGDQPVKADVLARAVGSSVEEIQALLVELRAAGVFRQTRGGVIYSKRMTDDHKRSKEGRRAKLEALEAAKENRRPSRAPASPPTTQKPEARGKVEGSIKPSTLPERRPGGARHEGAPQPAAWQGPPEIREAVVNRMSEGWAQAWLDPCDWDEEARAIIAPRGLTVTQLEQNVRRDLVHAKVTAVRVKGRAA